MERPVNIKPEIYSFILEKSSGQDVRTFLENPIPFLILNNIFESPELLVDVIFQLDSGEEVIISKESIDQFKKDEKVRLNFIYRLGERDYIKLTPSQFIEQFTQSMHLDYKER